MSLISEKIDVDLVTCYEFIYSFRKDYLFPELTLEDLDTILIDPDYASCLDKIYFSLLRPILEPLESLPDTESEIQLIPMLRFVRKKLDDLELSFYWIEILKLVLQNQTCDYLEIWKETAVINTVKYLKYLSRDNFYEILTRRQKIEILKFLVDSQNELKSFRSKAENRTTSLREIQEKASALREKLEEMNKKRAELVDTYMIKRFKSSTISREIDLRASGNNYKKVAHHMDIIKKGISILEIEYLEKSPSLLAFNEEGNELYYLSNHFLLYKGTDEEEAKTCKSLNETELEEYIEGLKVSKIDTEELEASISSIKDHLSRETTLIGKQSLLSEKENILKIKKQGLPTRVKDFCKKFRETIDYISEAGKIETENERFIQRSILKMEKKYSKDPSASEEDMEVDTSDEELCSLFSSLDPSKEVKVSLQREAGFCEKIKSIIKELLQSFHEKKVLRETKLNRYSFKLMKSGALQDFIRESKNIQGLELSIFIIQDYFKMSAATS